MTHASPLYSRRRSAGSVLAMASLLVAAACSRSGGGDTADLAAAKIRLERVEFGRLVDVYGLGDDGSLALFERDVVIGTNVEDERPPESTVADSAIRYDFFGADPDTLQPRLLIPRALGSAEFAAAYAALDDQLRAVEPILTGTGGPGRPYPVVPRNAALRLTMSAPLGVGDDFFVERDASGRVVGLRNTEAVQLLRIAGDPAQSNAFVPLPVRVIAKANTFVLDPVLLGSEGIQYQAPNNAAGMPESADAAGANMRIALALEGPLAVPGLRPGASELLGTNNSERQSIVRDFRSGNVRDTSADLTRGFVRDGLPLRLLGDLPMFVERIDPATASTVDVTVWKGGLRHEIDRGDVFRFVSASGTEVLGTAEVVIDPLDDRDAPDTQRVRVRVRAFAGLLELDPRALPGYPATPTEREPWLRRFAPRANCLCEFTAGGAGGRDDPRNFLVFTPAPLPLGGVQPAANEFVSPSAEAIVRFTKPVDLTTVRWADTFFFAMRDLTDPEQIARFREEVANGTPTPGLRADVFNEAKYRTPFLIAARLFDETGSQTSLRLQPTSGFYLDETMRTPPPGADYRYFLHLIADSADGAIRDLAGNALDLQGTTAARANSVVIPFTVDTRRNGEQPLFPDNIVVSLVRRFADRDEDERPSWFRPEEVQPPIGASRADAAAIDDLFGAFVLVDGLLQPRPVTRSRLVADNRNQAPVVQNSPSPLPPLALAWCPQRVFNGGGGEDQRGSNSTNNLVQQPIQSPLNPFGCRLQTLWREVDLSLSRTNPFDFNLDIEGMYWAPFTGGDVPFDEFDRAQLFLSTSEYRPIPCVGDFSSLPSLPQSGLRPQFAANPLWNPRPDGGGTQSESTAPIRRAFDAPWTIDVAQAVREPTGVNRFLPMPAFSKPYFVFRDETVMEQGGNAGDGSDLSPAGNPTGFMPHLVSPFLNGQGRRWIDVVQGPTSAATFVDAYWNDAPNRLLTGAGPDVRTGGLVGSIGLPLLADFQVSCDRADLPLGDPYLALGTNGWQVSITVQSSAPPNFRVLTGGRPAAHPLGSQCLEPSSPGWSTAIGAWSPPSPATPGWTQGPAGDNTLYWIMLDVLRRQTVVTAGFVDLLDPHRVREGHPDPRLGPFWLDNGVSILPSDVVPDFVHETDPPLARMPAGVTFVPQFRAAGNVDPSPWYWKAWIDTPNALFPTPSEQNPGFTAAARAALRPDADNFPLDPLKAGDAHVRKWDSRNNRNTWTHFYNRVVTSYVDDPDRLVDPEFTQQYSIATEAFTPRDVRYVNWRFVIGSNADVEPPVSPAIESFALSYRFTRR